MDACRGGNDTARYLDITHGDGLPGIQGVDIDDERAETLVGLYVLQLLCKLGVVIACRSERRGDAGGRLAEPEDIDDARVGASALCEKGHFRRLELVAAGRSGTEGECIGEAYGIFLGYGLEVDHQTAACLVYRQIGTHGDVAGSDVGKQRAAHLALQGIGGIELPGQGARGQHLLITTRIRVLPLYHIGIDRLYQRSLLGAVGRVVVLHGQFIVGLRIAAEHNLLHEGIAVHLQVGVVLRIVEREELCIAGIVGIQSVSGLPGIGHAILVGVEIGRTTARAKVFLGVAIDVAHLVYTA